MTGLRICGLACIVVLAFPGAALAHANLIRSDPPNGAVVVSPPRVVRLFAGAALFTLTLRRAAEPPQGLFLVAFGLVVAGGIPLVAQTSLSTRFGAVVLGAVVVAAVGAAIAAGAHRYPQVSLSHIEPTGVILTALSTG